MISLLIRTGQSTHFSSISPQKLTLCCRKVRKGNLSEQERESRRERGLNYLNGTVCPTHLASPVCISSWFTHDLYTSTGLVLIIRDLSSIISFTTGARSWRRVFCPRAPRLKLTTILMTVGLPVTISCIWSTLELYQEQKSFQILHMYTVNLAFYIFFKIHTFKIILFISYIS